MNNKTNNQDKISSNNKNTLKNNTGVSNKTSNSTSPKASNAPSPKESNAPSPKESNATSNKTSNATSNKTSNASNAASPKESNDLSSMFNNDKNDINMKGLNLNELSELKGMTNNALNNSLVTKKPLKDEIKELTTDTLKKTKNIKTKSIEGVKDLFKKKSYEEKKLNKIKKKERKEKRIEKRIAKHNKDKQELGYSSANRIITLIIITAIIILLIYAISYYYKGAFSNYGDKITLLSGVRDATTGIVISQDPKNPDYNLIKKSFNVSGGGGAQFTYSFWFSINNMEYRKGEWKQMWNKGDSDGTINRTPGVYLHPTKNSISIFLNTLKHSNGDNLSSDDLFESVEIDNIPLKKWINMVIIFTENKKSIKPGENKVFRNALDIYINGFLKTRKELFSVPIFNEEDLNITRSGGYDGVIGNLEYYPRAITPNEVSKLLKTCPKDSQCGVKLDCPSYLNNNWWFNM